MSKKKETEQITETPTPVYFESHMWRDVVQVYRCTTCGYCDEDKDRMIEHVLTHVPPEQQDGILDELLKE